MTDLTQQFDVAVVGAGPAGSSVAIRLANAGLKVVLVEQKKFPRAKLCGEFISPECLTHFDDLGIMPDIMSGGGNDLTETVFYARNGKGIAVKSEWFGQASTSALGLSRAAMDELLLRRAVEVGVDVREDVTVVGVAMEGECVTGVCTRNKDGVESSISSRLTIDATGRTRSVARRLETADGPKTRAQHVAFKAHIKGARTKSDACEIFAYRGGYGGCNRVEGGVYNLCFIASSEDTRSRGSDPERVLREVVFGNSRAAETLTDAKVVSEWLAVPIERFGRGELIPAEGLLAVGDAAAFIDPFTGSGILLALESAKIASAVIAESFAAGLDLAEMAEAYRQKYASAFDRRLRVCAMLRYAAFVPLLADMTVSALSLSTGLRRRLAQATRFDPRSNNV